MTKCPWWPTLPLAALSGCFRLGKSATTEPRHLQGRNEPGSSHSALKTSPCGDAVMSVEKAETLRLEDEHQRIGTVN